MIRRRMIRAASVSAAMVFDVAALSAQAVVRVLQIPICAAKAFVRPDERPAPRSFR